MSNLITTTSSNGLSKVDNAIIESRRSKKIIECKDVEIREALIYIMVLLGQNAKTIQEFSSTIAITVLIKSLRRGFPHLKIEELKTAFDLASDQSFEIDLSLYGKVFNSEYVAKVVKKYKEFRKSTIVKEQKMLEAPKPEPSEADKKKIVDEGIEQAYQKYKESGILARPCAWIYQELENSGTVVHSLEEKNHFYSQAKAKENNRLEELKKTSDFLGIKSILKMQEFGGNENKLKTIARELALKSYWDELIMTEQI